MALYEINADATRGSGLFFRGRAGEAVVRGQVVYKGADGQWFLADADAVASMPALGLTLDVASVAGQIIRILAPGGFMGRSDWAWTTGGELYASGVAGNMTQTIPAGPGDVVQVVGMATKTNQVQFNPKGAGPDTMSSNTLEGSTAFVGFDATKAGYVNYFLCDGTADDVQINAAEAYVTALTGGTVELERGTYNVIAPIIPTGNNIWYKGQGADTFIDGDGLATTEHVFHVTGRDDIHISDMSMQTEDAGAKTCHCIHIEDGSDRFRVERIIFVESDTHAINIEGTNIVSGWIEDCVVLGADNSAISVDMDGANTSSYFHIKNNTFTGCGATGIIFDGTGAGHLHHEITGNIVHTCSLHGFSLRELTDCNISDNTAYNNTRHGIYLIDSDNNVISNNICDENDSGDSGTYDGINLDSSSTDNIIDGNYLYGNHRDGMRISGARNEVSNNISQVNDRHGLVVEGAQSLIDGNYSYDNGADSAGTYHGIFMGDGTDRSIVSNNQCVGDGAGQEDGIFVSSGAHNLSITGNHCYDGMGSGISLEDNNDNCGIVGNYCMNNDDYGIEITTANAADNLVKDNSLVGNVTGQILDNGVDTKLAVAPFQFTEAINGAIVTASPTGVDVDANTEGALAWGQLPVESQQIVRLKVWGVATDAPIGAGGQMHGEFTFNAGASNAAYNTAAKSWTIANHDGEEADYVANDVVHWVIEDGDVGNELAALAAGDSFEMIVTHEAGADPDGATDCLFRVLEVEYV